MRGNNLFRAILLDSFWPNRRFGVLNVLHFCNDGIQACSLVLLPLAAGSLGLTTLQIGYVTAAQIAVGVIAAIPAGKLAARVGGNAVLTGAAALCGAALIVTSICGQRLFATAFVSAGMAFGVFHPVAFGLLNRHSKSGRKGKSMSTFTAIGDLGRIAICAAAMAAVAAVGWRGICAGLGALSFTAMGIAGFVLARAWTMPVEPSPASTQTRKKLAPGAIGLLLHNRAFAMVSLLTVLDALSGITLPIFLPLLLIEKSLGPQLSGIAITSFFVANFVGKALTGHLADRWGNLPVLIACEVGMAGSAVGLCFCSGPWLLVPLVVCLGITAKGALPLLLTMTAERLADENTELGFSVQQIIVNAATAAAPLLMGYIAALFGTAATLWIMGAMCVLIAVIAGMERIRELWRSHDPYPAVLIANPKLS